MINGINRVFRKRWVQEVLLFASLFFITTLNEGIEIINPETLRDSFFLFSLAYLHAQIHRFWVLPIFYEHNKPILYGLVSVTTIVLFATISYFTDEVSVSLGWYDDFPENHLHLFLFYCTSYFLSLCILLFLHLLLRAYHQQKKENEHHLLIKTMELELLRNQLNPHFIFNTFNNLYGVSLHAPERVPELLLQFSQLMRYQLENSKKEWETLAECITFINAYITLENERIGNRCNVQYHISEYDSKLNEYKLAPMILFSFIENAFKHTCYYVQEAFIVIELEIDFQEIKLFVSNSTGVQSENVAPMGTGLENTRQRLELLYPGRFDLQISRTSSTHDVTLRLALGSMLRK